MDRSHSPAPHRPAAVRAAGSAALDLLLSAAAGEHGEPASAPPARPTLHEAPVLREPQDGRRVGDQSQTRATADAHSGHRSPLSQTELEPPGTGSPDLPVSAARRGNPPAQPRLEHRYYLHSDAWRLKEGKKMKTKLIAVMLVAGGSAFAQGQFGGDANGGGPGYNGAQGGPGYNGAPGY